MIGIIDYGVGNLRSVQKAFERVGSEATILGNAQQTRGVDRLVLPGVGAFADGMANLRAGGWIDPIREFIQTGKPFLGVCLGMQLLFDGSEEDAPNDRELVPGLAILQGAVRRFRGDAFGAGRLKVPLMGWNTLNIRPGNPLFAGFADGEAVYFVHSYHCRPSRDGDIAATTDYGSPFCSSVHRDNVWATQFHPEKSQRVGLRMLANFAAL